MERKLKHLELIQGIISRLAQSSFLLKGWSVVLVSALFALAAKDANRLFIYLAYFPAVSFWLLDAYFLRQERLYRSLYDTIRTKDPDAIDFSMDTSEAASSGAERLTFCSSLLSPTLFGFHGTLVGVILLIMAVVLWPSGGN